MNAQEYYQSLLSQGYSTEAAKTHTQQDYSDFVGDGPAPLLSESQAISSHSPASMEMNTENILTGISNIPLSGLVGAESRYKG